jgi:hypothetical protein
MDTILLFKKDLEKYPIDSLRVLHRYLGLPAAYEKDLAWLIAIHHAGSNDWGTMKGKVEWEEKVVTGERDVPTKEEEERGAVKDIEWTKLDYRTHVRFCLQHILKEFDVWDIEGIEELLATGRIDRNTQLNLRACLNLLRGKSRPSDRNRVQNFARDHVAMLNREQQEQLRLFSEDEQQEERDLEQLELERAAELVRQIGEEFARNKSRSKYPLISRLLAERNLMAEALEHVTPAQRLVLQEQLQEQSPTQVLQREDDRRAMDERRRERVEEERR